MSDFILIPKDYMVGDHDCREQYFTYSHAERGNADYKSCHYNLNIISKNR